MNATAKRILAFYMRTFAVWVVVFGIVAYFVPGPFIAIKGGLFWYFAVTMFGIGMVLEPKDFKRIAEQPQIVVIGTVAQYTIMPLLGFVLAKAFQLPDDLAVGLILTACAPDAMACSVLTYIAKADVAYSVSLTTATTLICPVATPGLTWVLAHARMEVAFWTMFWDVIGMVIAPLLAGLIARRLLKRRIDPIVEVFPAVSATFIIIVCSMIIALNRGYLPKLTVGVFVAAVLLNILGLAGGYMAGWATHMNRARCRTLAIQVGMQNAGLGSVLALRHFGERAALPSAIFVFICIIIPSFLASRWQRTPPEPAANQEAEVRATGS